MRPYLGLRTRITLVIVVITTATAAVMAFAAYRLQASTIEGRFTAAAIAGFRSDVDQARNFEGNQLPLVAVIDYMRGRRGIDWALLDSRTGPVRGAYPVDGLTATSVIGSSINSPLSRLTELPADLVDAARRGGTPRAELAGGAAPVLALGAYLGDDVVLFEFYDLGPMRQELASLQRTLVFIAVVVAAVGLVAALLAAHAVQRPVRRVAAAARRLGQGELDVRLAVRGRDELADLTRSFNTMAGRLGESIEELTAKDRQQRRFIADVTHDLRTPVAAMIAAVDSLADPEVRASSARLLGTQSRRLARLVEDLLEISRFDAGVADLRPEPVDLRALLLDAISVSGGQATVSGEATVTADPRRLHTIACNLLANAVQHGADPVTVTIDGTGPDQVVVRVADSGPGVPPDLAPILFDRFVRGDRSRGATEGSGLGLAIARENAVVHGGRLDVHNEGGAVFTLTLPR